MDAENLTVEEHVIENPHVPDNHYGGMEAIRMITECLSRYDTPQDREFDCSILPGSQEIEEEEFPFREEESTTSIMEELLEHARTPLFAGASTNRLVSTLLLLNCFTVFGVSNAFADELLTLMHILLPKDNLLPRSHYEARKYVAKLGLSYNSIHACRNGCCLFRKELLGALSCPKCNAPRYKSETSQRPAKLLRHFPLIPRLRRMYRCKRLAELNKWHATREKEGTNVECVPDSKAWKHIEAMDGNFTAEHRNIRLGMALDGVNPFSNQSLSHSTWPVLLVNYNLPAWLVTKPFFIMMALLIPGKESVTSENIDVYLAPLIEELQELWEGVPAIDVSEEPQKQQFTLRALLLWCIHDYPAYGLTSGQVTKGYRACTECGPHVSTRRSKALGKNVYLGHRRYLNRRHPYRRLRQAFDGETEDRPPPPVLTGTDIRGYAEERDSWKQKSQGRRGGGEDDPIHRHGVKRLSALFALPYWQVGAGL